MTCIRIFTVLETKQKILKNKQNLTALTKHSFVFRSRNINIYINTTKQAMLLDFR